MPRFVVTSPVSTRSASRAGGGSVATSASVAFAGVEVVTAISTSAAMLSERPRRSRRYAHGMARAEIDRRAMAALSSGHMAVDFAGGVLPALLPFLVTSGTSRTRTRRGLILASALAASVVQPLFGFWSDRRGAVWLLPAGVAIGAIGMGLAALSPSYWWVVLFVVVSGLGHRRVSPGRLEVRRLRKRRQACQRHVVVLDRRQPRLLARRHRHDADRGRTRDQGRRARRPPVPRRGGDPAVAGAVSPLVRARSQHRARGRPAGTTAWARWHCCWALSPYAASPGSG